MASSSAPHFLLFPYMAKGHIIPLLHLSHHLLRHGAAVTFLTTPSNLHFIRTSLPAAVTILTIPFPANVPGIPSGVDSVHELPDFSLWITFAAATKLMKPQFEHILESILPDSVISDDFFGWTLESAKKFNIPRLSYSAMGCTPLSLSFAASAGRVLHGGDDNVLKFRDYPWIQIKKEDFDPIYLEPEFSGTQYRELVLENLQASSESHGILINTFYELESAYIDAWNSVLRPQLWCIGPTNLITTSTSIHNSYQIPKWINWLDQNRNLGHKVLYVAFGSHVEISKQQFREIEIGLERSGVKFLWVVRGENVPEEAYEERVRDRGLVVKEWVNQWEILEHESVHGYMTHCGWGSVVESVCAKVPILALPIMWEQPMTAMMVVDDLRVGLRVETRNRAVEWQKLAEAARELMEGESGDLVRRNVAEMGSAAVRAVEEGGSSWQSLNELVNEVRNIKENNH